MDDGFRNGSEEYKRIKASLLDRKVLFEDPDFPAGPKSINWRNTSSYGIQWMRPKEISPSAKFTVDGATRCDLDQGELMDCWFVAATACLATSHKQLLERCVPSNQDFDKNYAGIFRFNFWRFGKWVEVLVDDYLPTKGRQLMYAHNIEEPNEFWVPLFEKAYAKLNGCYDNLSGGYATDALVDFTGGISEYIDITPKRKSPGDLFEIMYSMMQMSSLIGTHINASRILQESLPNGLFRGHAYSVTNLIKLKVKGTTMRLMRIRNPWGKDEWTGRWSDKSQDWTNIPDKVKQEVGYANLDDGEFWMSFEDWLANFEVLTLCHLDPDAVTAEISENRGKSMWEVETHQANWVRGMNAGGSGNPPNQKYFWTNPQFLVSTNLPSGAPSADQLCHTVVSLMQRTNDNKPKFGISCVLYQLKEGTPLLLNGQNYDAAATILSSPPTKFINLREVTNHFDVKPGNYIIIPCTYDTNNECEFLLRIYTETKSDSQMLDVQTTITKDALPSDNLSELYTKCTRGESKMEAKELMVALNQTYANGNAANTFGIESTRSILAMFDKDRTGFLTSEAFHKLMVEVNVWGEKFKTFDTDRSGDIDTYELQNIFRAVGLQVSRQVMESIVRRYGGKRCRVSFVDFIHCCCKITNMYNQFLLFSKDGIKGKAELSLEQWMATTVLF